jgi:D-alanyl-D-alanine carboxypeptidase/D-alanyl-D-alanine-endopeptidase (penicillin-binding protein 4)
MHYVKNSGAYRRRSRRLRARRRAALFAALLLPVIVLAAVFAARAHRRNVAPPVRPSAAAAAVPRASAVPWPAHDVQAVRSAVAAALAPALSGAEAWSCIVIAPGGSVLFQDRARHAAVPASVQKLIVTDGALTELGPGYRFDTLFGVSKAPSGGTIDGDLWVAMSGDPSFQSRDIAQGVRALAATGLRRIAGSVVVDGSAIGGEEINPLWNADDANEDFMAATSGASLDDDTVQFVVTGTQNGEPADVRVYPPSRFVHYDGQIETGGGDDVTIGGTAEPNSFRLSGSIPPGAREKFWLPVHGMPQYVAAVVTGYLKRAGIEVAGAPRTGTMPLDASILWEHRSEPLPVLLKHMLVFSDNHFAEQLMRVLGATGGDTADDRTGLQAERHILQAQAIPTPGLHVVDGSGLAHANRVSAETLASILQHFEAAPDGNALYGLLPRGGKDGTLKRYDFGAALGRVRAKSGHLSDAAALAGYVDTRTHGRLIFAFLVDGSPGDPDSDMISAVDALAER